MNAFFRATLKTRLLLLILFAFLPAFGLALVSSTQRLHARQAEQKDSALRLARVMERSHHELLAEAISFLQAVTRVTPPERLEPATCRTTLNDLVQNFPRYDTFGLAAPNGEVYCSSEPQRLKGNISQLRFFRDAMTTHLPAPGPYEMDPLLGKPIVFIGVPLTNEARQITAVLFVAFDLTGFTGWTNRLQMPSNSLMVVFDQSGLVLARYPDIDKWTGRVQPQAPLVRYVRDHGEEGVAELTGENGARRLFAYTAIHKTSEQTVFLALGQAADEAYGGAYSAFLYDMLSVALGLALALGLVWASTDALVIHRLRRLTETADRIRNGDLRVRSGLGPSEDEAGQLAGAIDRMAEEIDRRMTTLQQRGHEMRQLRDMTDALQACLTSEEVYAVVRQYMQLLLPGRAGALYMLGAGGDHYTQVAQWQDPATEREFLPNDCWAVRRGKSYRVDIGSGESIRCRHVQAPPPFSYLCVPLMVQGEITGMLHVENDDDFPVAENDPGSQSLVEAAAEHAGLRLAHIRLANHLHDQAMRDGLTGLFNRRYMEESLVREIRNAQRNQTPIAIIMLDIDHFKRFNDTFGHAAGDALLRRIGGMLQTEMRGGDLACRYGGEEFTVILPDTGLPQAFEVAEKLRQKTKRLHVQLNGAEVGEVTISLGVAAYPEHGAGWEDVLHAADMALLRAKQTRDRAVLFQN
ncbi:MAG: diguanylate cyclase [Burkholderiaceae bacterium]